MVIEVTFDIDIEKYLKEQRSKVDNHLRNIFEKNNSFIEPKELWNALRYSLLNGGKRIRAIMCLGTFETLIEQERLNYLLDDCLTIASSIELIHTMSLIHDDLPCMDNDDLRRGKLSCHKAFNESTAILVGDAMLSLAFNLIVQDTKNISQEQKLEIIYQLSSAFSFGLVPGQILDLSLNEKQSAIDVVKKVNELKTAKLIKASILCGAIASLNNNKEKIKEALSNFGEKIGIAFQIIDDILDLTSDTKTLGKTSRKDEKQKKSTYPMLTGVKDSKDFAKDLTSQAKAELEKVDIKNPILYSLADYIINRIN